MSNAKQIDVSGLTEVVASLTLVASKDDVLPELLGKDVIKSDQDLNIRTPLLKLDTAIHANAVQCMLHAQKHGDTSLMRRLLVDIVDGKSGYRRQGLIAWMRRYSPMELHGDVIKLTGTVNGQPIPWDILGAMKQSFRDIPEFAEVVVLKPLYRGGFMGQIQRAQKAYKEAIANTLVENGKVVGPIDPKKPFYSGIHLDKMDEIFDEISKAASKFETFSDDTADVAALRKQHELSGKQLAERETQLAGLPKGA